MAKKKNMSAVDKVAKRFGITAREVRDIVTAVGTSAKTATMKTGPRLSSDVRANLKQQISEVGSAATKGKKGTRSGQYRVVSTESGDKRFERYVGPKRVTKLEKGATWKESKPKNKKK